MTSPGRNDLCPCGSGKKYKKCHGAAGAPPASRTAASTLTLADPQRVFDEALSLHQSGLLAEAEAQYRRLLADYPDHPHLLHNIGLIRFQHGGIDEAADLVRRALQGEPDNAKFLGSLGAILSAAGRPDEAIQSFRSAGASLRNDPEALSNYAVALGKVGQLSEAIAACERSLQLLPGHVDTLNNLGNLLTDSRRYAEATLRFREALLRRCDAAKVHSNLLLLLNYDDAISPQQLLAEHRAFGEAQGALWDALPAQHDNSLEPTRRLRIGYVSADFGAHPVGYLLCDVLGRHERESFEVTLYATQPRQDDITAKFRAACDRWHDCSQLSDTEFELLIRRDRIDILVDLGGHTAGNRLPVLARRPAPVQISYLGYTTTTGLASLGYRLSDALIDPPGTNAGSERTLVLKQGMFRYYPPASAPLPSAPPLQSGKVPTFGCFCNLAKVSPRTVALWAKVLTQRPDTRLLIKAKALADRAVRDTLLAEFEAQGVDAQRIECLGWTGHEQHLADYARIDVMLDTLPFNLAANTCEALWMGVPVVTRVGDGPAGRIGASLLSAAGLPECVTDSDEAFVNQACELIADAEALTRKRMKMRDQLRASSLLDSASLAAELDKIYRDVWSKWVATAAPIPTASPQRSVLHVGCGSPEAGKLPSYFSAGHWQELRLDIDPRVKPDYEASITDMSCVPDGTANAVYSSHNVEHVFSHEVQPTLREFKRVLRAKGFALIVVPDLQLAAERVLSGDLDRPVYQSPAGPVGALDMIYGAADLVRGGNLFMMHKTGFTAASMRRQLLEAGFEHVVVERRGYALWAVGFKP